MVAELQQVAQKVLDGGVEPICLGAHLFAWADWVLRTDGAYEVTRELRAWRRDRMARRPAGFEGALDLCEACRGWRPRRPAERHLRDLLDGLVAIDRHYAPFGSGDDPFPRETELQGTAGHGPRGVVRHWWRPASATGRLRNAVLSRIPKLPDDGPESPPRRELKVNQLLNHLAFAWQTSGVGARWRPADHDAHRRRTQPLLSRSGDWADGHGAAGLRIALCPLAGSGHPLFKVHGAGEGEELGTFNVDDSRPHSGPDLISRALAHLLETADAAMVNLILLPELMVPESALSALKSLVDASDNVDGIISGSFHIWRGGGEPHNHLELVGRDGTSLLAHDKSSRVQVTRKQFTTMKAFFPTIRDPSEFPRVAEERICSGSTLEILDCPLGRLACLICKDAIDQLNEGFHREVIESAPDFVFVAAMSAECDAFDSSATKWSEMSVGTLFVNAAPILHASPDEPLAFVQLPWPEIDSAAPVRVRWTAAGGLERWSFHDRKGWRSLVPTLGGDAPIFLLKGDLGMVLDLGALCSTLTPSAASAKKRK